MRQGRLSKGLVVGAVVLGMLAATPLASFALDPGGTFSDDNGSVHEGAIEAIADEGITRGCNPPANTLYCPSSTVTREQMASFLVRALDLPAGTSSFTDIDSSIHKVDIAALAAAGITAGCNPPANTLYCPRDPVTRAQMASFLARGLGLDISPRIVVTADQDLLGVQMGTSEAQTVAALTALLGPPTADMPWSCPYVVAPNMRRVSWGSLSATVFTRDTGSGLGLAGWRYSLLGGSAEPGGPAAVHVELPFGLELSDRIGDAVTATGNPIKTTAFSFTEVDLGYGAVEAEGTSIDPNAPITGVHQGFGHSCE